MPLRPPKETQALQPGWYLSSFTLGKDFDGKERHPGCEPPRSHHVPPFASEKPKNQLRKSKASAPRATSPVRPVREAVCHDT